MDLLKVISIIRDVVQLDETFVKSTIVEKEGKKYGLIDLPSFYIDFMMQITEILLKTWKKKLSD